jgi:putative ABC transport system permease protein
MRHAIRILLKNPSVFIVAIFTLALGIGANTAIFSIINGVLLAPFPYSEPKKIVALWESVEKEGNNKWRVAPANFLDWKQQNTHFEKMAAFGSTALNLTGNGEPEQLNGVHVTAEYFSVLGVRPIIGRSFVPIENEPGRNRVVILSQNLWKHRFASDKQILGKTIVLDGAHYEVVGVMPDGVYPAWPRTSGGIQFDQSYHQFWIPTSITPQFKINRRSHVLGVIARLRSRAKFTEAQAEMKTIGLNLEQKYSENKDEGISVVPFIDEIVGTVRPALMILFGTVAFVLMIACANVASLLLAKLASRSREMSIRSALGASKSHLFGQFLQESLWIVFLGGAIGVWLASATVNVIMKLIPQQIPRMNQVSVDHRVLIFTFIICLLTSVFFAIIMAVRSMTTNLVESLKQAERGSSESKAGKRFQQSLVVVQLAIAVLLVLGAGLLLRSFWQLQKVDPGFNPDQLLVADIVLPGSRYSTWDQVNNFYSQWNERIRAVPGVRSAALAYDHPLESNWIQGFEIEGYLAPQVEPGGRFIPVSPGYFKTAGIELLTGREFTDSDDPDHPGVVVVNETLVRKYFANENPIGKVLRITPPSMIWGKDMPESFQITGIVRDVKFLGLDSEVEPAFYIPAAQIALNDMKLLVRTSGDPLALVSAIRTSTWELDPDQPIARFSTMNAILDETLAARRFNMVLMTLFGFVALILASTGVYGVFSYNVSLQTSEIGVRLALGARPRNILTMVLGRGLVLVLGGTIIGVVAALVLTRYLSSQLFGITSTDPVSYVSVTLLLAIVALIACYIPARRAMRVDPIVALRYE